ncbi:HAD hydrolase-like protein [Streptomyces sp. NBC_00335]|uniref:HAD family hydrolase n=1 Tax=unclassified Streptomyces TaxID=2593676 RepID=UPI002252E1E1|nr:MULTISPECIES: HAD family hydrolase [unclassified Streptomyces]MCX5407157.1 HAD hydrolase-like protein [Streptomyces sp. NBC_00086]
MQELSEALAEVLAASRAVLFDFDGPICDVFRGLPAPGVAKELADLVALHDPQLGERARGTDDPMEVHRISVEGGPSLLGVVEDALTAAELRAVKVAGAPVAGAVQALRAARGAKWRVAVVSNNSAECVRAFLASNGIADAVDEVIGRPRLRPDLMKPAPYPLLTAAKTLGVDPAETVLIGDAVTDVAAAKAAAARSIGFANKPPKRSTLANAGADVVVLDMWVVADALALRGPEDRQD